jgi:hypothetical protein
MLHKDKFHELERQAWRDSNPLVDELVKTRAEIVYLLRIAQSVASRYDCVINNAFDPDDYASTALWATFINHIDSLERESGENL